MVLGAGPVGLLGAMALARRGYATTVYSRSPKPNPKAEASEAMGVPYISSKEVRPEELVRRVGAADVIYEAAGVAKAALETLKALGPNGVCILTGVPSKEEPFDVAPVLKDVVLGNQVLVGTVNAADVDFDMALEDLRHFQARWPGGWSGSSAPVIRPRTSATSSLARSPAASRTSSVSSDPFDKE